MAMAGPLLSYTKILEPAAQLSLTLAIEQARSLSSELMLELWLLAVLRRRDGTRVEHVARPAVE